MAHDIAKQFSVSLDGVPGIGDSLRDLVSFANAGCQPMLVLTGKGEKTLAEGNMPENTLVFNNLAEAVQHIVSLCNDHVLHWPTTPCCYLAIGQATSQTLADTSKQKVYFPEISDSEHLLAMPQLQNISGKRVTIVRGDSGREFIYDSTNNTLF